MSLFYTFPVFSTFFFKKNLGNFPHFCPKGGQTLVWNFPHFFLTGSLILLPQSRQLFSLWVMNTWLRQIAFCEHNLDEHHHLSLCNNTKQCGREILVEAFLLCWIMLTQKRKSMNINVQCYYEVFVLLAVLLTMLFVSFNKIVVPDICGHC